MLRSITDCLKNLVKFHILFAFDLGLATVKILISGHTVQRNAIDSELCFGCGCNLRERINQLTSAGATLTLAGWLWDCGNHGYWVTMLMHAVPASNPPCTWHLYAPHTRLPATGEQLQSKRGSVARGRGSGGTCLCLPQNFCRRCNVSHLL